MIPGWVEYGLVLATSGSVITAGVIGSKLIAELSGPPNSLFVFPSPTDLWWVYPRFWPIFNQSLIWWVELKRRFSLSKFEISDATIPSSSKYPNDE